MKKFVFQINPMPKVRMTGRSKWSKQSQDCLAFQKMIAWEAKIQGVPKLDDKKIGFALLHFYRYGRECDIDNLQKSFYDGLQYGEIFKNDKRIKAIDNLRVFDVKNAEDARIEFIIYNYKNVSKQNGINASTCIPCNRQIMS